MAHILVVDDDNLNRELLRAQLTSSGYDVSDMASGEEALIACERGNIDLVLLDVVMPGIGGLEALRRLKQSCAERSEYLPVVLVTALSDTASRRQGLDCGADDFLSKPFDSVELMLRVRNLLALRADRLSLAERNRRLVQLQRFKEEMSALLVHDLKNPTAVVLANLEFALGSLPSGVGNDTLVESLDDARDGCRRTLRLLANLLDVARAEDARLPLHRASLDLASIIEPLVVSRQLAIESRGRHVQLQLEPGIVAPLDADLVGRIVENVLDNALRYTPKGGTIVLSTKQVGGQIEVRVGNTGHPIPPEQRTTIFEKYAQGPRGDGVGVHSGLGLYFCRLAAEAHGGKIWVEEEAELPTVFVVSLPSIARPLQ